MMLHHGLMTEALVNLEIIPHMDMLWGQLLYNSTSFID